MQFAYYQEVCEIMHRIIILTLCLLQIIDLLLSQKDMGPGLWSVKNVDKCPDADNLMIQSNCNRTKLNRTHDSFNTEIILLESVDCTYSLLMEVYRLCDGGYKHQQTVEDKCACTFAEDKVYDNFLMATTLAGIPTECPLPLGIHNIYNFIINYEEMPPQCLYGEYLVEVYLIKEDVKVYCVKLELECEEKKEEPGGR